MRKSYLGKRHFLLVIVFSICCCLCAQDIRLASQGSSDDFRELLFQIDCLAVSGCSHRGEAGAFAELSRQGALLLMTPVWRASRPLWLYEEFYPDHRGEIESSLNTSSVYNDYSDIWIDSAFLSLNASLGLYSGDDGDLLSLLDNKSNGAVTEADGQETAVLNRLSSGELRRFSFQGEIFSVSRLGSLLQLTNTAEGNVVRRSYNSDYRLVKKEVFNNPKTYDSLVLDKTVLYFYGEQEPLLERTEEDNRKDKTFTQTLFGLNGKPVSSTIWKYEEKLGSTGDDAEESLVKTYEKEWAYDEENRLVRSSVTEFYTVKASRNKTVEKTDNKSYEYVYREFDKPDTRYYENGELRVETVYTGSDSYRQTLYFDGGFSVVSVFDDGLKTSETIFLNGAEIRRRQ